MAERHARQGTTALCCCGLVFAALTHAAWGAGADAVTEEARAAAFPDIPPSAMHAAMHADPVTWLLKAEEFEWQDRAGGDALKWDVTGWIGHDMNRLWLRDEGSHVAGTQVANELEVLWARPVAAWWDVMAGIRQDTGPGPSRTYAAFGVQGLAPQWFHVEATAYAGEGGQAGASVQVDYEWLLTNRLILTARADADAWSDDDPANGIGSGLADVTGGLRMRYEIRREFAPYVGIEWERLCGDTADVAQNSGEDTRDTRLVAGLRFWF